MKKQILVVFTGAMELGGIERSLIGLLDAIDYSKYDVDLFLYAHRGPLFDQINKNVNILPEVKELSYLRDSFLNKLKHGCYYSALLRLTDGLLSKFKNVSNDKTWDEILSKTVPNLEKKYDIAIGFFLPFGLIKSKVNSKCKIGWIHTDYNGEKHDSKSLINEYSDLDKIVAVSSSCRDSFTKLFPQFEKNTIVVENILSKQQIINAASEFSPDCFSYNSINLVSVGRFCTAKNFDNIPEICKLISEKGLNIKWYLIGFGGEEQLIKEKIAEFKIEDRVVILGKKENPYPYIKACDAYIQPSRYEGKCVAVREAQILEKPVIITNYATAKSQLKDGYDGVIVPRNNKGCAEGIYKVLTDKNLMKTLSYNCSQNDYTNSGEVNKIYDLI